MHWLTIIIPFLIVAIVIIVTTLIGRARGYNYGGRVVVRCRAGHLFTTLWVPGASFKAVRLGRSRLQRCPVGHHWSVVTPVRDADLTEEERAFAAQHSDGPIP